MFFLVALTWDVDVIIVFFSSTSLVAWKEAPSEI